MRTDGIAKLESMSRRYVWFGGSKRRTGAGRPCASMRCRITVRLRYATSTGVRWTRPIPERNTSAGAGARPAVRPRHGGGQALHGVRLLEQFRALGNAQPDGLL